MDLTTIFQMTYIVGTLAICMIVVYMPRIALTTSDSAEFSPRSLRILDLTNFFAVGVFLSTCFVMLMPHVEMTFTEAFSSYQWENETCYKLVQLVVMLGFLLVYFLEKILDHCKSSLSDASSTNDIHHHFQEQARADSAPNYVVTFQKMEEEDNNDEDELNREDENENENSTSKASITINKVVSESNNHHLRSAIRTKGDDDNDDDEEEEEEDEDDEDENKRLVSDERTIGLEKVTREKGGILKDLGAKSSKKLSHYADNDSENVPPKYGAIIGHFDVRCAAMLSALCVHSVFEGVTLGLQSMLWRFLGLAGAVAIHQITAAMAIGVSLTKRRLSRISFFISSLVFSAAIPLGVVVGIVLSNFTEVNRSKELHAMEGSPAAKIIAACLQALTVGTFIYVIFVEIMPSELNRRRDQVLKVILLLVGFVLVTCLAFFLVKS